MADTKYVIGTQEGVDFVASHKGETAEVGDTVELDLRADQERALVAAGWIEPETKGKK